MVPRNFVMFPVGFAVLPTHGFSERIKELASDMIHIGTLVFMLLVFVSFWLTGTIHANEPNVFIRTVETCFILVGLILAIERFWSD